MNLFNQAGGTLEDEQEKKELSIDELLANLPALLQTQAI